MYVDFALQTYSSSIEIPNKANWHLGNIKVLRIVLAKLAEL
jgi:hypothetical protein